MSVKMMRNSVYVIEYNIVIDYFFFINPIKDTEILGASCKV